MPIVSISRYEIEQRILPPVCIVTGELTTHTERQVLRWIPGWIPGLYITGVVIRILAGVAFGQAGTSPPCFLYVFLAPLMLIPTVALFKLKPITWEVPIVYRKRHYWDIRRLGSLIGVMTCVILIIGGGTNSNEMNGIRGEPDYGLWASRVGLVGFVVVAIILHIVKRNSVRPLEINATHVTLANVHENFAVALEIERTRHAELEAVRYDAYVAWQIEKDKAEFAGWGTGHARAIRLQPDATVETDGDDERILLRSAEDELQSSPPKPDELRPGPADVKTPT